MNIEILTAFLSEANKSTYANKNALKSTSLRPSSKDYHFEKENLIYHDTYFGERNFIGEEIIYQDQKPVWGANYYGFILDEKLNEKDVYSFLRKALLQKNNDIISVRGPRKFSENNWTYKFLVDGDFSRFTGQEEILHDGEVIYRLFIHGGLISL